jgi:hypothetical protein
VLRDTIFFVRLGSCIALEVATGVLTLSAAAWGIAFAAGAVRGEPHRERVAAVAVPVAPAVAPAVDRTPAAVDRTPPPAPPLDAGAAAVAATIDDPDIEIEPTIDAGPPAGALTPDWTFIGQPDEVLLAPLRTGDVARVKFNGGGSSLSIRLEFADGSKAAFKPDQIHRQSDPRKEIAAYRIDRLLALGRVPPAIGRSFPMRELTAKVASSHREYAHRLVDEAVPRGGVLRGELSWWIPVLGTGYVDGKYKIDGAEGVSRWKRWLQADGEIPAADLAMCQQLSNVTVFDFLIDNLDRWSGGNAITTEDGSTLYFMDNQMAFSLDSRGHRKSHGNLERVEKFSRGLVGRLRVLDEAMLREVLAPDTGPFDQLLTGPEIKALLARRDVFLGYVDELIARHGEAKVLAFP